MRSVSAPVVARGNTDKLRQALGVVKASTYGIAEGWALCASPVAPTHGLGWLYRANACV
jgi:hypothetical protein